MSARTRKSRKINPKTYQSISLFNPQKIKNEILENKINFLIGLATVSIIFLVSYQFILKNQFFKIKPKTKEIINQKKTISASQEKKYKVKEGDTLWKIAENFYGSGFNAVDIALFNKISNPDLITEGQELIIPSISPKTPTKGEIISNQTEKVIQYQKKYIIKPGDTLWKIALENYGDGYAWVKIANQNKIVNPDIIEPETTLILP